MNREIKFRGLRTDGNGWAYGYFVVKDGYHIIYTGNTSDSYVVIPKSVGQYTGLKDKNGVEIYEGDKVKDNSGRVMVIGWSEIFASFVLTADDWAFQHWFGEAVSPKGVEVIGNIHQEREVSNG